MKDIKLRNSISSLLYALSRTARWAAAIAIAIWAFGSLALSIDRTSILSVSRAIITGLSMAIIIDILIFNSQGTFMHKD